MIWYYSCSHAPYLYSKKITCGDINNNICPYVKMKIFKSFQRQRLISLPNVSKRFFRWLPFIAVVENGTMMTSTKRRKWEDIFLFLRAEIFKGLILCSNYLSYILLINCKTCLRPVGLGVDFLPHMRKVLGSNPGCASFSKSFLFRLFFNDFSVHISQF